MIVATDLEGMLTVFNTGAEKMLGYEANEVIGKYNLMAFYSPAEIDQRGVQLTEQYGYLIEGFNVFVQMLGKDGTRQRTWTVRKKDGRN